jgi:hypothetical protein
MAGPEDSGQKSEVRRQMRQSGFWVQSLKAKGLKTCFISSIGLIGSIGSIDQLI